MFGACFLLKLLSSHMHQHTHEHMNTQTHMLGTMRAVIAIKMRQTHHLTMCAHSIFDLIYGNSTTKMFVK